MNSIANSIRDYTVEYEDERRRYLMTIEARDYDEAVRIFDRDNPDVRRIACYPTENTGEAA
jgi:hypothetical protein